MIFTDGVNQKNRNNDDDDVNLMKHAYRQNNEKLIYF